MADLAYVLRQLPPQHDPDLLAGSNRADDAAVYRLSDDLALVQTVDFFTPIVDDPYTFGEIAAANSLSDVYAMGGRPLTAMNIVGFPIKSLPSSVLVEILRGGASKAAEAGVTMVGGHTVDDEEPKYGLSVTGTVNPGRFMTARGAVPGDLLILTKPIGTGVIATAIKAGEGTAAHVSQAVRWMTALNCTASEAMMAAEAHAASDITGFGLLGHLLDLCSASGVGAEVEVAAVPLLPGALEYARAGFVPGGTQTNLDYIHESMRTVEVRHVNQTLLADPQTSGGLLISLAPERLTAFRELNGDDALSAVIGRVTDASRGITLRE